MSCSRNATCDFCDARCPDYIFDFSSHYIEKYNFNTIDWDKFEDDFISWYDAGKPDSNIEEFGFDNVAHVFISEYCGDEIDATQESCEYDGRVFQTYVYKIKERYFLTNYYKSVSGFYKNDFSNSDIYEVKPTYITIKNWEYI